LGEEIKIMFDQLTQKCHFCDMAKTVILRTRVDPEKATAAEKVCSKLGISLGDAINLFLGQVCIQKGIPFPLTTRLHLDLSNATLEQIENRYVERIPTAKTAAALQEKPARRFNNAAQVLRSLKG
jgi:addiction module RelB/DinJ family antitoxin